MSFSLYLLLTAVLLLALAIWLRSLVVRRVDPRRLLTELEQEVAALTAEVNQAGDHNISLLEDRIGQLRTLTEAARAAEERLTGLLERVTQDPAVETYVLSLERHRLSSNDDAEPGAEGESATEPTAPSTSGAAAGPEAPPHAADGAPGARDAPGPPDRELSRPGRGGAPDGTDTAAEAGTDTGSMTAKPMSVAERRDAVLAAYGRGMALEEIAVRTGMTLGEIELIISLREQRSRR